MYLKKQKQNMNQKKSLKKDTNLNSFFQSKKGKYSLVSVLALSVLLISGLFTYNLLKQDSDTAKAANTAATAFNPSDCATYTSNGGTNTAGVCFVKMYEKNGQLYRSLDIAPGELVNVRNYYNNTTTASVTAANITDSMPANFTRVGAVTNSYVDATPVTLNNNVFTGQNLSVAPGAGYFGYAADNTLTSSNLELGKKRYFIINECDYNQGNVNITYNRTPAGVPSNTVPSGITCQTTGYGAGGPASIVPIDIAGKRNMYIAECDYNTNNATITYNRTGNSGATNGTVPATNCVTTGYVFSGAHQLNFDLLGNRYVHLAECDYSGGTITYNRTGNFTANNTATLSVVCSATGFGAAVGGTSITSDLSDTTRGHGYISYSMQAPASGLTNGQQVGTTGTLTASGAKTSGTASSLTVNFTSLLEVECSITDPCALFETALSYSPTQALAKRYGASGSTNSDNLILTLKDTRLEQSGFTTTCSIKYKFRTDTSYRTLTTNSTYNNTTGCTGNLLKANQLLFNVDFEITAITTNTTTNTTKNYLIYSNYDFKAGSIGVTSIGGSGL